MCSRTQQELDRGIQRHQAQDVEGALAIYQGVLRDNPRDPDALHLLGLARHHLGDPEQGAALIRQALDLHPAASHYWNNLGLALQALGRTEEALQAFGRALALSPGDGQVLTNRGQAAYEGFRYAEAERDWREALRLQPDLAKAWNNLGNLLQISGRAGEADACFARAIDLDPADPATASNRLYNLQMVPGGSPEDRFAAHRAWAGRFCPGPGPARPWPHLAWDGPLRIGYLSPDLRSHSVAFFLLPLLAHRDRARFQVHCYSGTLAPDAMTRDLQALASGWRSTLGCPDEALAQRIRDDGIHILVDLAGHTAGNRLPVLALRPAPIQGTWLGYPDTTGSTAVDFRFTDADLEAGGLDRFSAEAPWALPLGMYCYRPPAGAPPVSPLPARATGGITFASFNNLAKVHAGVIAAWAAILRRVPGSRLYLKAKTLASPAVRGDLLEQFQDLGVPPGRLLLEGFTIGEAEHLRCYHQVDIALDTFPCNGGTITCAALSMGVPVVSLRGDRRMGRLGSAILGKVGLGHLVAEDEAGYVAAATALAADLEALAALRSGLGDRMERSPLRDEAGFTRGVEAAYLELARRHRPPPG